MEKSVSAKPPRLMARIIEQAARDLAQDSAVLAEHRQAFYERALQAQHAAWAQARAKEYVKVGTQRVYISTKLQTEREARHERIVEALNQGETVCEIAERERVSKSLVRWCRATARE